MWEYVLPFPIYIFVGRESLECNVLFDKWVDGRIGFVALKRWGQKKFKGFKNVETNTERDRVGIGLCSLFDTGLYKEKERL